MRLFLLFSVAVVATCGLIYELVAGTLASYLLGDSVTQFSTIIGTYLFAMGIGSYLSKYIKQNLLQTFVTIEVLIGIIGGCSSAVLFILFSQIESFRFLLYGLMSVTGILVGLEIPLMMRILQEEFDFGDLVSKIFSVDYAGALLASLAFPLFFVPRLGIIKTSLFFGMMNIAVAMLLIVLKKDELSNYRLLKLTTVAAFVVLFVGFIKGDAIMHYAEQINYNEHIIHSSSSKYQRITLTSDRKGTKLYLNNNLQFYSADEYRYHEALVHPLFTLQPQAKDILVLGGGDGCAVREILKYPKVETVTLVDLDDEMTRLFTQNDRLKRINGNSLLSDRVKVINADAFTWLQAQQKRFDIVVVDFPDPSNYSVGKLYSTAFYQELKKHLNPHAVFVVQSTSPFVAPNSYWCVTNTLNAVGFHVLPYHDYVPSFGEWGYTIGSLDTVLQPNYGVLPPQLRFFDSTAFSAMITFSKDMAHRPTSINQLNNQALVQYFEDEWSE